MEADAAAEESGATKRQVFVRCNGKALRTTVEAVAAFFETVGKPVSIRNKWGEEPDDGSIYETALVTFKKNKAVEKAVALSGGTIGDRQVLVGINSRPPPVKKQACRSCRVFVGNLPFNADDAAVRAHFSSCGKVLFVRFATTASQASKRKKETEEIPAGFAFVIFADPDGKASAAHAALGLNGSMLYEREVSVAPAVEHTREASSRKTKGGGGEQEAKRLRPSEWRHDKATGLTAPRPKKKWEAKGSDPEKEWPADE